MSLGLFLFVRLVVRVILVHRSTCGWLILLMVPLLPGSHRASNEFLAQSSIANIFQPEFPRKTRGESDLFSFQDVVKELFPPEAPNAVTIQQQPKQPLRLLFSPKKKQQKKPQRILFSPEAPMNSPQRVVFSPEAFTHRDHNFER